MAGTKTRRTVITAARAPRGGHPVLYAFSYADFAVFFGYGPGQLGALRMAVRRGRVDLASLDSIHAFKIRRDARAARKAARAARETS